jgi:hypothetical protein
VSFAAKTVCVASQRVFIAISVYFVIDSVWKLLDTPSYSSGEFLALLWEPKGQQAESSSHIHTLFL